MKFFVWEVEGKEMRIAQVAPLFESVPPKLYGGTERIVSYLTEELVRMGHEVTLFASLDSGTRARLEAVCPKALRLDTQVKDPLAHHVLMLEQVLSKADSFDLVHFHIDYIHFPMARRMETAHVTTLHGRLDLPDLKPLYREFKDMPLVSISDNQRRPMSWANWRKTIYHGLPEDLYMPSFRPGEYLAFLGRISPEKRPDRAIEIAKRAGIPLKIAAKVDRADSDYFEQKIRALLDHPLIEFIGEISDREKNEFLSGALGLLFPIDWPEPFGLVMIESMACATPVIAYDRGSVPEVMVDGITGFIVRNVDQAVEAVKRLWAIDRRACRKIFEERFTSRRMAKEYVELYHSLVYTRFRPRLAA
jgi:glycosyltransferase involved in cell wall biosynthesis